MNYKANRNAIKESKVNLKKSLGQNFLTDKNIVEKIVNTANVDSQTNIIEIGPGIGALTQLLINRSLFVTSVEIDKQLIPVLDESFGSNQNFELIHGDFLQLDPKVFDTHQAKITKVVANLPYYITTAIITKILTEMPFVDEIIIMVQKEVAQRITSAAGNKAYGSLSVYCQLSCETNYEFTVKRTVFMPPPNVDSAIISLKRKEINFDLECVEKFVKNCFRQKRKTLVNNLHSSYNIEKELITKLLTANGFSPSVRAEQIVPEDFIILNEKFTEEFM